MYKCESLLLQFPTAKLNVESKVGVVDYLLGCLKDLVF